jgi:hypothetical protein
MYRLQENHINNKYKRIDINNIYIYVLLVHILTLTIINFWLLTAIVII